MTAEIIELDEQCKRRRYIALAHASDDWQQIKASFAIEGMSLGDNNSEVVGRMIAGEITLEEAKKVLLCRLNPAEQI